MFISGAAAFGVQKHQVGCLRDQHSDSPNRPRKLPQRYIQNNSLLLDNVILPYFCLYKKFATNDEEKKDYAFPETKATNSK